MLETTHEPHDRTQVDIALLIVRIVAGVIMAAHGSQKLFGWFGGPGLSAVMSPNFPGGGGVIGLLVAIGEGFGGLGMLFGVLPRFSALANTVSMLGAIALVHAKNGFFLHPEHMGFEYNLALIGLFLAILIAGPGKYSISHFVKLGKRDSSRVTATDGI
jgi:putative oxidoreductase